MNANELRIGNLVELAIKMEGSLIERCRVKDNILEVNKEFIFGELNTFCNPIPLTEEWLLKFGFNKLKEYGLNISYWYSIKIRPCTTLEINQTRKSLIVFYSKKGYGTHATLIKYIKYVHQLQNLYFALTQTELEIK